METGGFSKQRASNAEKASIWWRHHELINVSKRTPAIRRCMLHNRHIADYKHSIPEISRVIWQVWHRHYLSRNPFTINHANTVSLKRWYYKKRRTRSCEILMVWIIKSLGMKTIPSNGSFVRHNPRVDLVLGPFLLLHCLGIVNHCIIQISHCYVRHY